MGNLKEAGETAINVAHTGVIHGRFQVLHNDHMKYLLAGKKCCSHLVVGITNPDPLTIKKESADEKRGMDSANLLTYYERYSLVREAFGACGIPAGEFSIVPFPISRPELYEYYVPMDAVFFLSIYDDWGEKKLEYFKSLNLAYHVLWKINRDEKGLSAGDIRMSMACGKPWEHLVPESTIALLKKWNIPDRIKVAMELDAVDKNGLNRIS